MKKYIYFILFIIIFTTYTGCSSQADSLITEVVNDKDYYEYKRLIYKELGYYTPGKSLNKEILDVIKKHSMYNVKDFCVVNLEYFQDIPNAVEYLKNLCEIDKVFIKLNSKYGAQFLKDNFQEISDEFDKIYQNSPEKKGTLRRTKH
ncbi:MAG: hypothetical protein IPL55_12240 [Saprospiraceae bacterium]|jgi:hypothetical protein|nr:hypothetical protein [Saprospiraceae bacterium]